MKNLREKKKILIVVGLLGILTLLIGVSYAYWVLTFRQTDENIVNSGCFKIEFTEKNPINLANAFPMYDRDGMKNTPYTFTIKNVCNSSATFQINLESLVPSGKALPDNYVKTNLSEGTSSKVTTKLLDSIQTETTISGAVKAYKLYTGILDPNETKEFNLRLWMDESVEAVEDAMNASYSGKVSIIASYYEDNRGTLKSVVWNTTTEFWEYKDKITNIVMEDTMTPKETDLTWDVSSEGNGSVMSYLVRNEGEEELYALYLQSEGGIKANQDISWLFANFTKLESIEGLENFDTSKVINMNYMFRNCNKLVSLDLNHFDTSNVTNMQGIFSNCSNLTNLNLSSFDTSKVTIMSSMFDGCSNLTGLDLSSFDTSNVTEMQQMFQGCSNLTSLDLSHFDTSKVKSMISMFSGCSSLININLSSFDTSNAKSMRLMFYKCNSLMDLDLSSFNTNKVTEMQQMFQGCSNLTSLDLSHFDTNNVTNMSNMFANMPTTTIVKVKDATVQNWVLTSSNGHSSSWTTENVVIV